MEHPMPVNGDPPSVPRRRRLTLVLTRLLVAVLAVVAVFMGVDWLASGGALAPEVVWLAAGFVSAPVVAALAWSVAARWDDRVELWDDRLVRWERGSPEAFALADAARLDARLSGLREVLGLETPVGLRVVMQDGRVLAIDELPFREAQPVIRLVGEVLLTRWYEALRRGGSVACADAPVFPWLPVAVLAVVGGLTAWLVVLEGTRAMSSVVRAALALLSARGLLVRGLQTWWVARRTGGVEMSLSGIVPLGAAAGAAPRLEPAPYRAASGPALPWTPWSGVGEVLIDGYGLQVPCAHRDEPLVLSGRTQNLFLVSEFIQAMRSARLLRDPPRD